MDQQETYEIQTARPRGADFDDLRLPELTAQLSSIRALGRRNMLFAVLLASITLFFARDGVFEVIRSLAELVGIHQFPDNDEVAAVYAISIVFLTITGSLALIQPRLCEYIAAYVDQFDRVVAIARQITLADGIGDSDRRKAASDILWRAKALRKTAKQKLTRTAAVNIALACAPWIVIVSLHDMLAIDLVYQIAAYIIIAIQLFLLHKVIST